MSPGSAVDAAARRFTLGQMDTLMLSGTITGGAQWTLSSDDTPPVPGVVLQVRTATEQPYWSTGSPSTPLPPSQVIGGAPFSGDDDEPVTWLMKLHTDVRTVIVQLSDGTREDLYVMDDLHHPGVRWAVLAHPHQLHVDRVDVYDVNDTALPTTAPPQAPA